MLTRGAVKAAAGAGAKERARAKALRHLWRACRQSDLKKLTVVLREHAAELEGALDTQDLQDDYLATALVFAAAMSNFPAGVELLLKAGASVNKKIRGGSTALTLSSFFGNDEVVALLLKFGASINQATDNGCTALFFAVQEGQDKMVGMLLEHGADVDLANNEGATPLYEAALRGKAGAAALLLKHGASVDLPSPGGVNLLDIASMHGQISVMKLLLEHKANLHAVNNQGTNALHIAAFADQPEACLLLISHGLDPAVANNLGASALSHYGDWLDGNAPENEDVNDHRTHPELSPEAKAERRALLTAAREAFLRRDANWKRRFPFLDALVGSQLRATAAVAAQQKLEQAAVDTSAKLPAVPRDREWLKRQVLMHEGNVRLVASFL